MSTFDPDALECLAAIVEEGGFERAAVRLSITQSAVSQRLRSLEVQVGTVLIVRSRPLKPTSAGRLLLKHAMQMRLLRADLERDLKELAPGASASGVDQEQISIAINADAYPQMDGLVGERCDYNLDTREFDCAPTDKPDGALRGYYGAPATSRTDMMFTWSINVDGGNPLVGSGALDGNGITADFFTDVNVRRGFAYCMDWDVIINDVYQGDAVQNVGPIIPGMLG